jgi:trigger factor
VSDTSIGEDNTLSYQALIEVYPEFELPAYTGLKVKVPASEVSNEEVDQQLESLQERNASLAPVFDDRPLAQGDFAVLDYVTTVVGTGESTEKENVTVEVGGGQLIDEFEAALPGMKPGDVREINVTFPDNFGDPKLAGQAVHYKVTLGSIKKKELPELDDELAKEVGADDLADLKAKIREELQEMHERKRRDEVQKKIMDQILEKLEFEVPPSVLQNQLRALHASAAQVLGENQMRMDKKAADDLKEQLRDQAERRAREVIVLERIIEAEGIQISEEDLAAEYQKMANAYQQPVASVAAYHEQSGRKSVLISQLREAKALDFLERNNKVTK